ncbi:glycosyltransferase family 4 protein [Betaproteobacteria bacterium PRO7]|nr:glycosyltransferase family 4 protein [Betaproteobacteria bacterium PRO7]
MTAVLELWFAPIVAALAWVGTVALRRYGLQKLLDVPNERSSHAQPIPRGGGVAIVLSFAAGALVLWARGAMPDRLMLALVAGGGLVAAVGFWDDHVNLSARLRLALHVVAAVIAVTLLGPVQHLPLAGATWLVPTWVAWPVSVVAVCWLLNLYNFMDGIDGIAAGEAVSVALAAALIAGLVGVSTPGLLLLAAAAAGFLALNWPPARIFMGDAGSGFLGYVFGVYLLFSANTDARLVWVWVILLAVFWVDATITLARRAAAGQRWYAAHRTHAYQHAAVRLGRHRPVTLAVIAINALVLLPFAAFAALRPQHAYICATVATVALAGTALALGAGRNVTR